MKYLLFISVIVASLSVVLNIFLFNQSSSYHNPEIIPPTNYIYLSPRIQQTVTNEIFLNFTPLRSILRKYTSSLNSPVNLYFEYLPSGTSIGVNESMDNPTASLIKIPTVMAIYAKAEQGQIDLEQLVTITERHIDKGFGTLWQQGVGHTITINQAIYKTISESDNTAHNILYNLLTAQDREKVYEQLDIEFVSSEQGDSYRITPKSYTSILKSLYFSTYLSKVSSQKILEFMTQTTDKSKLAAALPNNVAIAHKIGVNENNSQLKFYHDCGIIYLTKRPYALCVMTQENNEDTASNIIKTISKFVYDYMSTVN